MLQSIVRFSLRNRLLVVSTALFLVVYGAWQIARLGIDVFPNLNRPRVTVMTEAAGLAPEEVETLITFPMETALNGATGVQAVRTVSGVGLSVVWVEFDWDTDIYDDRQIVAERLNMVADRLPKGLVPQLAPISSVMGQIMIMGLWSEDGSTDPMQLRTLADWVVRQRLLTIPGVSQVFVMGGQRKQFQVLVDPGKLLRYGVTLHNVKEALSKSNGNATGGYLDQQGPQELLVRSLGRIRSTDDLKKVVITIRDGRSIQVGQVARVLEGPQVKRGDSAAFVRNYQEGPSRKAQTRDGPVANFQGGPAVILTVNKQPDADTREVSRQITEALRSLRSSLPADVRVNTELYEQRVFIDLAIENVIDALRDGSLLVVAVLFLFLMNFRTTLITLSAIPLSVVITGLTFYYFDLSINTMTLGGLAVAIGELVDDAIVGVENVHRRLRENSDRQKPESTLLVVYRASVEVRNPIVFGTLIVVLVFLPVFALQGMEGRLFTPIGIAYIVSILSSLLVSLTVTPVLAYVLLPSQRRSSQRGDAFVLRTVKRLAGLLIGLSVRNSWAVLLTVTASVGVAIGGALMLENDFLPPFNEGAVQINVVLPPGTSLATSEQIIRKVEERLQRVDEIVAFVRKTGRAELDEHAVTVNISEIIASIDTDSARDREQILTDLREALADIPGIVTSVEQPLAHLISHMLSGVKAQIGIKLFGDDLSLLRQHAESIRQIVSTVPGVTDLQVEPQIDIPQLRIQIDREKLATFGLTSQDINEYVETAMHGRVISQVVLGQRSFDLLVRLDEPFREDLESVKRLSLDLPEGGTTNLGAVADVYRAAGPNTINREQVRRRIVIQCNTSGRGLVDVVNEIQTRLRPYEEELPTGYFLSFEGQFESQQSASRMIGALFALALVGMLLVLYTMFRSVNLSLQVMIALPAAFIGSVAALHLTGQTLTVAAMVGFISLCGIASRNGILLINHYLHLVAFEGETWSVDMMVRAGKERLAPVLMTALTSGIALIPLALAAGEPGKEILYPVATVIIGGLVSSTLLEFLVRPALFWRFGVSAARRALAQWEEGEPLLDDENATRKMIERED